MSLKATEECETCGRLLVKGGAYRSHVRSCGTPTRRRTRYRELFFANNGSGPYSCFFCEEFVTMDVVIVHHIDEDFTNDSIENLSAAHDSCHTSHHFKETWRTQRAEILKSETRGHRVPHSEETKDKLSAEHKEKGIMPSLEARSMGGKVPWTEERRASLSSYAKNRSPEHQEKLRQAQLGRKFSDETRKKMSEAAKRRRKREQPTID